jgi:sporulation protein YlmC with PRC-barrel domain
VNRLSQLLGQKVRSESGKHLGRVHDVRAELRPRSIAITGLVVGRLGYLERLGIGAPETRGRSLRQDVIAWSDVVRADARGVVVRDTED